MYSWFSFEGVSRRILEQVRIPLNHAIVSKKQGMLYEKPTTSEYFLGGWVCRAFRGILVEARCQRNIAETFDPPMLSSRSRVCLKHVKYVDHQQQLAFWKRFACPCLIHWRFNLSRHVGELRGEFEQKLGEDRDLRMQFNEEKMELHKKFAETRRQVEDDIDTEIDNLR